MIEKVKTNIGNLMLSISDAVEMVSPVVASHQLRTSYIAWQIALAAKLPETSVEKLYKAALLHDIGALAPEEKIKLHAFETKKTEPHCVIGELLFRMTPILEDAARIVRFHHRKGCDWHCTIEDPDVLEAQILFLADYVERLIRRDVFILNQTETVLAKLKKKAGKEIHPGVVEVLMDIALREDFWLDIVNSKLHALMRDHGPLHGVEDDFTMLVSIASLVKNLIDFKSNFTAAHSAGVTECAVQLASLEGFTEFEVMCMEIAGNFHDLGKLAIPVAILDKPEALTREEYNTMKQHPYLTYMALKNTGMGQIAEWAAFHHEFLDGSGYPFHLNDENLTTGARIMAVAEMFGSLSEERPYRPVRDKKEVKDILTVYSKNNLLDSRTVNLLIENYDEINSMVEEKRAEARRYYSKKIEQHPA